MVTRRTLLTTGAVAVLGAGGTLLGLSPGAPAPLFNDDGTPIPASISERVFVNLNGIRQGMIIQSANPANPVLLFLHGGPGMPEFFLNTTHPSGL